MDSMRDRERQTRNTLHDETCPLPQPERRTLERGRGEPVSLKPLLILPYTHTHTHRERCLVFNSYVLEIISMDSKRERDIYIYIEGETEKERHVWSTLGHRDLSL